MVNLVVTAGCLGHVLEILSAGLGAFGACLVLNKNCLEHQVYAFPDCSLMSPQWPVTRVYCLQKLPPKRRAAEHLPYHVEELEEVHVGVQGVFHPLQGALREGAQAATHCLSRSALGKDQETLQEGLAAGDVLQHQVWDSMSKLQKGKATVETSLCRKTLAPQ